MSSQSCSVQGNICKLPVRLTNCATTFAQWLQNIDKPSFITGIGVYLA